MNMNSRKKVFARNKQSVAYTSTVKFRLIGSCSVSTQKTTL